MKIKRDQIPERTNKLVSHRVEIVEKSYGFSVRLKNHILSFLPFIIFAVLSIPVGNYIIAKQTEKYFLIPIIYGLGIVLYLILWKLEQVTVPEVDIASLTTTQKVQLIYIVYPSEFEKAQIVFGLKLVIDQYDEGQVFLEYLSSHYNEMVELGKWLTKMISGISGNLIEFNPMDLQKSEFPVRFALHYRSTHRKKQEFPQMDLTHPTYEQLGKKRQPYKKIY